MRSRALLLGWIVSAGAWAATPENIGPVEAMIHREDYRSALALVNLRMALKPELAASDRLRYLLLRAEIAGFTGDRESARDSLREARQLYESDFQGQNLFLTEIELTEYDLQTNSETR